MTPAARLGDPTSHGGTLTSGSPDVFVNSRPAVRVGDAHACPMQQPIPPSPAPAPHVGGSVLPGAPPKVLINGRPPCVEGQVLQCAVPLPPPNTVAAGSSDVFYGS